MKTRIIDPLAFFKGKRPEPIVIVQTENGPRMLTPKEVRERMSPNKPQNDWWTQFLDRIQQFIQSL